MGFRHLCASCKTPLMRALRPQAASFSSASCRVDPNAEKTDLHAAWASLAAYDSDAMGGRLKRMAVGAATKLNDVGYKLATTFIVPGGMAKSFDGTREVQEADAAYLFFREADGRGILSFRGSDTAQDLEHVRSAKKISMYGHVLHAGVAAGEFFPLVSKMKAADFKDMKTLVVTGHSLGGGCASMLAVLMNDPNDPLDFGESRKFVDELYGFGATPVFHNSEFETPNADWEDYGDQRNPGGFFKGAIYRTMAEQDGEEVQDQAFRLINEFHFPKTNLVSLRAKTPPAVLMSSTVKGQPGWRHVVQETPVAKNLMPLHSPLNYVNWLGDTATSCGFSVSEDK